MRPRCWGSGDGSARWERSRRGGYPGQRQGYTACKLKAAATIRLIDRRFADHGHGTVVRE